MNRVLGAVAVLASVFAASRADAGTVKRETYGDRTIRVYTPDRLGARRALVVMLHGCTQTADAFADATGMDSVADDEGFVVAYPEQSTTADPNRCYRWWDPSHQKRDVGEPKELADAASAMATASGLDPERVYVAGLSAGGAMSVVLGATYPDRFTAIGVVAGLEYGAASSFASAFSAATSGGPDPTTQGRLAYEAMGANARAMPVLVIHGDADRVVAPVNGSQAAAQWVATNTLVLGGGAIAPARRMEVYAEAGGGRDYAREVHESTTNGGAVVEYLLVRGLAHAWPGGRAGGSFSDPAGPVASRLVWAFFRDRTRSQPIPAGGKADATDADDAAPNDPAAAQAGAAPDDAGCALAASRRASGPLVLGAILLLVFALRARRTTLSRR